MPKTDTNDTEQLFQLVEMLSVAATELSRYPALERHAAEFYAATHHLRLPPFVVVMGSFNSGKSTLLNAMLGQKLLSMNVLPETATVTMLRKGKKGKVFEHNEGQPVRKWPVSKLASLSAETVRDSAVLSESISFLEVPFDIPLLEKVTLVDTPGVNSTYATHEAATKKFLHKAESVLWVVSCWQTLNSVEAAWIKELHPDVRVLVVINRIDDINFDQDAISRLSEKIINNLKQPNISVTAVSAKLALEGIIAKNKDTFNASLWPLFMQDCERDVFQFDPRKRTERAFRNASSLILSLHEDIRRHLHAANQCRVKAKGGQELFDSLKEKKKMLTDAKLALHKYKDAGSAVLLLKIEPSWPGSQELNIKRQSLASAFLAINEEQIEINRAIGIFNEKFYQVKADIDEFNVDWENYMKSGFLGGEPKIFTGEKKKLLARKSVLDRRQSVLNEGRKDFLNKQQELRAVRERTIADCDAFIQEVENAISNAIDSTVMESKSSVDNQRKAAKELKEYEWLSDYASKVINGKLLPSVKMITNEDLTIEYEGDLHSCFQSFYKTMKGISDMDWNVSIPEILSDNRVKWINESIIEFVSSSLTIVARLIRIGYAITKEICLLPFKIFYTYVKFARRAPVRAIILAVICWFSVSKIWTWKQTFISSQNISHSSTTELSASTSTELPTLTVKEAADDYIAIRNALSSDGFVADGQILDVPETLGGETLHVQKVTCADLAQACRKLLVFSGRESVWSEDIADYTSVSPFSSGEPGKFSARLSQQLPDGTESASTVLYAWDGAHLIRTPDLVTPGSPTNEETASQGQPPSDAVSSAINRRSSASGNPSAEKQAHQLQNNSQGEPSTAEIYQQAADFYNQKRYVEASPLFYKACIGGRADACSVLGGMYNRGWGVEQDYSKSAAFLLKSCNGGDAYGCSSLGNCYRLGLGVEKDINQARELLTKGCNMDIQWSCDRLTELHAELAQAHSGVLHYHGHPVALGGKVVFDNLPKGRLKFTYDSSAWDLIIKHNPDGTKWVTLISLKHGNQTSCDLGWEIIE